MEDKADRKREANYKNRLARRKRHREAKPFNHFAHTYEKVVPKHHSVYDRVQAAEKHIQEIVKKRASFTDRMKELSQFHQGEVTKILSIYKRLQTELAYCYKLAEKDSDEKLMETINGYQQQRRKEAAEMRSIIEKAEKMLGDDAIMDSLPPDQWHMHLAKY